MTTSTAVRSPAGARTRRIVLSVLAAVALALGALTAVVGGALMALFGSGNTLASGVQQISTPTRALVSPAAAIQNTTGVQTIFGTVRLRITATAAGTGQRIFLGIGPASAVDRYLSGVSHDVATNLTVTPFQLTVTRHPGAAVPAPPASQPFWVAQAAGNHASLSWNVTDGSYRVVAMNASGAPAVRLGIQVALTIPHLFAIGVGLLAGGVLVLLLGGLLLLFAVRARPAPPGAGSPGSMPAQAGPTPAELAPARDAAPAQDTPISKSGAEP